MTNRIKSKYQSVKKLTNVYKNLWGNNKKDFCRSLLKVKKKKISFFGKLLLIKQSLKLFYSNIKEKSFKKYLNLAVISPSKTIDKLISSLERRLDTVLFRSLFVSSFSNARQLISHGLVSVNDKIIFSSKKKLYKGDHVYLNRVFKSFSLFRFFVMIRGIPNYLEINYRFFSIIFLWDNNLINTYFPIDNNYSLISKFYK